MSSPYLSYLYSALAEKFGISLFCSDVTQARAALYKARTEANDPALQQISLHQSPFLPDTEVWLVKRPKKVLNEQRTETASPDPHSSPGESGGNHEDSSETSSETS